MTGDEPTSAEQPHRVQAPVLRGVVLAVALVGIAAFVVGVATLAFAQARRFLPDLALFAGAFLALGLRPLRLPSGSVLHPGIAVSIAGVFLVPVALLPLIPLPGLLLLTWRSGRSLFAYPLTVGHGALALYAAAGTYHLLWDGPFPSLPGMLPAVALALAVHELVQWSLSSAIVAHRNHVDPLEQLRNVVQRDLNWGTLGLGILGVTSAMVYREFGVWGLVLQVLVILCLFRTVAYYTRMDLWQQVAWTDGLTGAGSRSAWEAFVAAAEAPDKIRESTLFLVDLDRFKMVNDAHGHAVGDRVLRNLAVCLQQALRRTDRLFRYGGDEFIIFVAHGPAAAVLVRQRLEEALRNWEAEWGRRGIRVSASMGAVELPWAHGSWDDLFVLADRRMYQRKTQQVLAGSE